MLHVGSNSCWVGLNKILVDSLSGQTPFSPRKTSNLSAQTQLSFVVWSQTYSSVWDHGRKKEEDSPSGWQVLYGRNKTRKLKRLQQTYIASVSRETSIHRDQ